MEELLVVIMYRPYIYGVVILGVVLLSGGHAAAVGGGSFYEQTGNSGETVDTTTLAEEAINPPLRPAEWAEGDGQFPTYEQAETNGHSGYIERKSDDRRVGLRYAFDESAFDHEREQYLVVARVAWHANGAGNQRGVSTNAATQDIPGSSATAEWGTVRLPIDHTDDPYVELAAIYGHSYVASGTAVVRLHEITVVPVETIGQLSDEEILAAAATTPRESPAETTETESEPAIDASRSTGCRPGVGDPRMQAIQLHTDDTEIKQGDPGRITGAIAADITNNCPTTVQVTLELPSEMSVSGTQGIESGSGGLFTSTFVVEPGEVKGISADVTSSGSTAGTKEVHSTVTYFPVNHSNLAKRENTGSLEFVTLERPESDPETTTESLSDEIPGFTPIVTVIAFISAAVLLHCKRR